MWPVWQKQSTSSSFQELTHLFGHLSKFNSSLPPARGCLTPPFFASLLFQLHIPVHRSWPCTELMQPRKAAQNYINWRGGEFSAELANWPAWWFGRVPWVPLWGGRTRPFTPRSTLLRTGQAGGPEPGAQRAPPSPPCLARAHGPLSRSPSREMWEGSWAPTAAPIPPVPCSLATLRQRFSFLRFKAFSIHLRQQQGVKIPMFGR